MDLSPAYTTLRNKVVFTAADVEALVRTNRAAYRLIAGLQNAGLLARIRNNLYTTIEQDTTRPTATPYQIGCAITKSAHLCRRSALELHGFAEAGRQVDVASKTRFHHFTFNSVDYQYLPARIDIGIVHGFSEAGVRVTDYERTVVELIKDFEMLGSLEELFDRLLQVHSLDEDKVWQYLRAHDQQFLYQKVGFLGSLQPPLLRLPSSLLEACRSRIGDSRRYLSRAYQGESTFEASWQLMIPWRLLQMYGWSTV